MREWFATSEGLHEAVSMHGSPTEAARVLGGISERRARELWNLAKEGKPLRRRQRRDQGAAACTPGAKISENEALLASRPNPRGTDTLTAEELLREHGLEPDEWVWTVTVNEWDALTGDGGVTTLCQIKVHARRKVELAFTLPDPKPAGWSPQRPRRKAASGPLHIPVFADPHAPLNEPALCEAFEAYCVEHADRIERVIGLGDTDDNSAFSRHRKIPRTAADPTASNQAAYDLLARFRAAASDAEFHLLGGNHCAWATYRMRESFPQLEGFCLPGDDVPILNPRRLLRLDELGITWHDWGGGEYYDSLYVVFDDLVAMHGTRAGKRGGAVLEVEGWEGASVIQGHDHKLGMFVVVRRLPGGGTIQHKAISAGTLAVPDLAYSSKQDCAQGFVVLHDHRDGVWTPSFAYYNPATRETTCGDWRYAPAR